MPRRRSTSNNYYGQFKPTRPIATDDGIKARSQQGRFAKNWWAMRWIEAMERVVDKGRLSRGRSYARRGQVLSIEETRGGIVAQVQGSRPKPYKVTIQVNPLSDPQWDLVIDALTQQALFTAQLLAGEMPRDVDQAFRNAGVSLFPAKRGDLVTSCSCPDWANPCKHVAATHYILGERFDEDPFLLFRLRGRTQEQILQGLRKHRAGQALEEDLSGEEDDEPEVIIPLEETLDHFWSFGDEGRTLRSQFSVSIQPPAIEMILLKRLGEPSFAADPGLQSILQPAFQAISKAALAVAFNDQVKEKDDEDSHN